MKADGFSLDQKRTEVPENDIPDVEERFFNLGGEASRSRKEQSFLVPVDEIRANDYILSINKYREIEREKVEYEATDVILERISNTEEDIVSAIEQLKKILM